MAEAVKLLTAKEAAAFLSTGKSTVYEWAALGLIPYVKLNGLLRFDEAELIAWVEAQKRAARKGPSIGARLAGKVLEAAAGGVTGGVIKHMTD